MSHRLVIVGGGPAGAMAAIRLAAAGLNPLLIERDAAPRHRICGEFLSSEAQACLAQAGVDADALGASRIDRLRLVHRDRVAAARLPFRARGLTRRAMDAALLDRAEAAGAEVRRGVAVRDISGTVLTLDGGEVIAPKTLLLASGKHDIRGAKRDPRGTVADLIGFKSYVRLVPEQTAALAGHIELILFRGGYAGLQLVEDGVANLCLLVSRARFEAAGGAWPGLLAALMAETAHLAMRLDGGTEQLDRPLTISNVPYGYIHRPQPSDPQGLYRLGDQFAVIPSFSGDGMSIAMHSGLAAAQAVLSGVDAATYHAARAAEIGPQIRLADRLYRLAQPPAAQWLAVAAARLWPGLAGRLAAWTRVPDAALRRAGL